MKYKVLLHNDNTSSMEHVVGALMHIFGFESQRAISMMREAHRWGMTECGAYNKEEAELRQEQMQTLGLNITLEPSWHEDN